MTTIEYKGVVTNIEAGHSAVVKCGGCEMEEEVIVRAGNEELDEIDALIGGDE